MISLKKYMEQEPEKMLRLALDAYREMLALTGDGARRGCPVTGQPLQKELSEASHSLGKSPTAENLRAAQKSVEKNLRLWSEQCEEYLRKKAAEVKEVLTELAGTAEFFGKRDQRYAAQFHQVTAKLQSIADLEDVTRIRASLLQSVGELKGCVERMTREGYDSIAHLEASLSQYQIKLEQAEELASHDPLTDLFNRREVEARIVRRIAHQIRFCVVIIDLDDFKHVNDKHGHIAGDELLRRIAAELRAACRASDIIGRLGGDEFILVLDCSLKSAQAQVDRLTPWVFGNYQLNLPSSRLDIAVTASIGIAEWEEGESMLEVLRRADADMYSHKALVRR